MEIDLLTEQDCVRILLASEPIGLEENMIKRFSPLYNVLHGGGYHEDPTATGPHSFRHYFFTTVLRASGNLKLAQELARHSNIAVTQRYAHISNDELDKGYHEIFEDPKKVTSPGEN